MSEQLLLFPLWEQIQVKKNVIAGMQAALDSIANREPTDSIVVDKMQREINKLKKELETLIEEENE